MIELFLLLIVSLSWGPKRRATVKKSSSSSGDYLKKNKRLTGILLLICIGALIGAWFFLQHTHDVTCAATGQTPGLLGLWGPCPPVGP